MVLKTGGRKKARFDRGPLVVLLAAVVAIVAIVAYVVPFDDVMASVRFSQARSMANDGRFEEALEMYERVIQQNPDHFNAHQDRAVVFRYMGRYEDSVEACRRTLERFPDAAITHCTKGWAYEYLNEYERAIEAHLRAIRLSPHWDYPKWRVVRCFEHLEDEKTRERLLEELGEADPDLVEVAESMLDSEPSPADRP